MPILAKSGRVVIAESIKARPVHVAWGSGDGAWIEPPSEDVDATALVNEIGRRLADVVSYVVPDEDGLIELSTGRFSLSEAPTNHLYIQVKFTFGDEPSGVIREIAAIVGTVTDPALPAGQRYFTPAQVVEPGRLMHLENLPPIFRSSAIEETFQIVITF